MTTTKAAPGDDFRRISSRIRPNQGCLQLPNWDFLTTADAVGGVSHSTTNSWSNYWNALSWVPPELFNTPIYNLLHAILFRKAVFLRSEKKLPDFDAATAARLISAWDPNVPENIQTLNDGIRYLIDAKPPLFTTKMAERIQAEWPLLNASAKAEIEALTWDGLPPIVPWNKLLDALPPPYVQALLTYAERLTSMICGWAHHQLTPTARTALGYGDPAVDVRVWKMVTSPIVMICSAVRYHQLTGKKAAKKFKRLFGITGESLEDVNDIFRLQYFSWIVQTIICWLDPRTCLLTDTPTESGQADLAYPEADLVA
jgi:hypothetical protein